MFRRFWRYGLVAMTALAVLMMAQPTLAWQQTSRQGTTGRYKVFDNSNDVGASCIYQDGPGSLVHLVSIWVYGPRIWPAAGYSEEKVGWQYTVQRKIQGQGWTDRVTSGVTKADAGPGYAEFIKVGKTKVIVPSGPDGPSASYRVVMKIIWYAQNGTTVIGTATGLLQAYEAYNAATSTAHGSCLDYEFG